MRQYLLFPVCMSEFQHDLLEAMLRSLRFCCVVATALLLVPGGSMRPMRAVVLHEQGL